MSSRFRPALVAAFLFAAAYAAASSAQAGEHPTAQPPAQHPAAGAPVANDPIVARVNGRQIHRSEVEEAERNLPEEDQKLPFAKVYPALVERLINGELLVDAGYKAHLDQSPEVRRALARYQDRLVQRAYIDRIINDGATEAKLKENYERLLKDTPPQDEVHARQILVPTEAEAKSIIAQLDKGADFATLARKYSKDPGTDSAGDLGYFTRDQMLPAFAKAAFALKVGHYSETPVKTAFGWHIIKIEDRRPAKPPTFAQVRNQLLRALATKLVNAKLKALRQDAKIELYGPSGKLLPPSKPAAASDNPKPKP